MAGILGLKSWFIHGLLFHRLPTLVSLLGTKWFIVCYLLLGSALLCICILSITGILTSHVISAHHNTTSFWSPVTILTLGCKRVNIGFWLHCIGQFYNLLNMR